MYFLFQAMNISHVNINVLPATSHWCWTSLEECKI